MQQCLLCCDYSHYYLRCQKFFFYPTDRKVQELLKSKNQKRLPFRKKKSSYVKNFKALRRKKHKLSIDCFKMSLQLDPSQIKKFDID